MRKILAAIPFLHHADGFCPWEEIDRKKLSKLRFLAEFRAFDGAI
jgi:hypothetical protein